MDNRIKNLIKKHGLAGVNRPKKTPSHPTKKGIVLAKEGDRVKLIRFGDQNMGHNYSPEARKSFKSRHAKNIAKGKMSAAYWADKAFWGGPGADKKMPPKSQEYTRGLKKYQDGGKVSQRPSYDEWKKKYNLKETDDYKLKEAYDLGYNPDKKTGHLPSINYKTGEFLKSGKHESVRKELDWYNSKEGAKFRAKNKIDSSGSYWKYVPKYAEGGKVATKTNPSLWEKAKAQAKARMGGKHSARAMQLAVSIYKKAGGGYKGPKKETGLSKWTKQDWTTSSGKPSEGKRRYLPRKAWSALSSAEKAATNRAKAEGNKQGKQFVAQPKTIAKKVVKYRR